MARGDQSGSRPRGESRERAIVAATLDLLAEMGYERLTMDAVAARAQASKATVYRRWPGKPQLVIDALRAHHEAEPVEPTEAGDLLELMRAIRDRFSAKNRGLMIGLLNAAEHDGELAAILRADMAAQKDGVRDLIASKAAASGLTSPGLELIGEVGASAVAMRILVFGETVDDEYLRRLVDEVMLPLLTHTTEGSLHD